MDDIPEWFWHVLHATRPNLSALESWLSSQPKQTLETFALAYLDAASELADYSEGVPIEGQRWSEDSTEDLCQWVVSQGHEFWHSVLTGEKGGLAEAARAYEGNPSACADLTDWDDEVTNPEHRGYQSPDAIVYGVYRTRFAEDLCDRLLDA